MTTPPSQVPLHNRYEALQVEPNNNKDDGSSSLEVLPRLSRPKPCIKTASIKKKIVIGDSLLKGTEGPIWRPDPLLREVCYLPGAWVKDVKRKLPTLVEPSVYYPLLIFQVGSTEVASRSPRAIKRDFGALG